jgi:colanic acid biosynthesis glycosyl transferase WcaI
MEMIMDLNAVQPRMRIVLLTQYFPPEVGAAQNRLSDLMRRVLQRGHEVTVLTAMPNYPSGRIHPGYGGLLRRETWEGMRIIRTFILTAERFGFVRRLASYFSFVLSSLVFGIVFLPRCQYLIVESPPLFLGISAYLLSRLKGARLIFNVSDLWPESAVSLNLLRAGSTAHRMGEYLEGFCYRKAWMVSGQSRGILENITGRFPQCRTWHLSNGVDVVRYGRNLRDEAFRKEFCPAGKTMVLYAGLHGLAQGLDQILDAAAAVGEDSGLVFVLVGDGPEKRMLEDRAGREKLTHVRFFSSRPAKEMPVLLASSDIILVPLKHDIPGAVPSKLYEAMASGVPVVLIVGGEAGNIVRTSGAGLVVEPGDIRGIVEAMRTLTAGPQDAVRCGENGRRAAEREFDRARIGERFVMELEARLPGSTDVRPTMKGNSRASG